MLAVLIHQQAKASSLAHMAEQTAYNAANSMKKHTLTNITPNNHAHPQGVDDKNQRVVAQENHTTTIKGKGCFSSPSVRQTIQLEFISLFFILYIPMLLRYCRFIRLSIIYRFVAAQWRGVKKEFL